MEFLRLPPISLYVHLPWCVRKCPYCDFNSHATHDNEPPAERYVDALLRDLAADAAPLNGRVVQTIFLGGGTPSLFPPESIARLLSGVRARVTISPNAEITLEANPGTVDASRFRGYVDAGVNRISIGIQSFDSEKLQALGRIHSANEALAAAGAARDAGFRNINLDLMYGLPGQNVTQALRDIETAIALAPTHLSVYQLTLEPNTVFHKYPPTLPDDDATDEMRDALIDRLTDGGYAQYEVSAYARTGWQCEHNKNYWQFGDYVGIGAGAHGKISQPKSVVRIAKTRHPDSYLRDAGTERARSTVTSLTPEDLICEFMLNALRLYHGCPARVFSERTGLPIEIVSAPLEKARNRNLVDVSAGCIRATELGRRFLNDLLMLFLPPSDARNSLEDKVPMAHHWNVC